MRGEGVEKIVEKVDSVEHWNWSHCGQKTCLLLSFVENYVRVKWKKS